MREIGIDSFYIELFENFKCSCIEQLLKREGEVIREIGKLNKVIPGYYSDSHRSLSLLRGSPYERPSVRRRLKRPQ